MNASITSPRCGPSVNADVDVDLRSYVPASRSVISYFDRHHLNLTGAKLSSTGPDGQSGCGNMPSVTCIRGGAAVTRRTARGWGRKGAPSPLSSVRPFTSLIA